MAGQIKSMLDAIVAQRSKGNPVIAMTTKTKLILKGVNPDLYNDLSPDDPVVMAKVRTIAAALGATV
jgi:hypothetical protein